MKKIWYFVLLLVAAAALFLFQFGMSSIDGSGYSNVSNKRAPSGEYTIYHVQSVAELGHAPYGDHLILSESSFVQKPEDGYVIFAGYCQPPLAYAWKSAKQIIIQCKARDPEKAHTITKTDIAFGIDVEVQYLQ